jgi:histidinol-phosphate aminotransferase
MSSIPVYQWQPTTSQIAASVGIQRSMVLRFDHNTSPSSPPWVPATAAAEARLAHEYPEADYAGLREAIAAYHGVTSDMVVPGAGADEMISLCARAFLDPGDVAVTDAPTYPLYRIATVQRGAEYREVERNDGLAYPSAALAEAAQRAALTWLCVPSNPVGDRPPDDLIAEIRRAAGGPVVIDAAYAEYAGDGWGHAVGADADVIVLGTLSKAFGLAGMRVGYAVAAPHRAAALEAIRPPGSISTISAAVAIRALTDVPWMRENVRRSLDAREDLDAKLRAVGLRPRASATNFLLVPVGGASRIAGGLLGKGIVARSFPHDHPLAASLRFTVRTPADHDRLADALQEVLL